MKSRRSVAKSVAAKSEEIAGSSNVRELRTLSEAEIWQVAGGVASHGDEDLAPLAGDEDISPIQPSPVRV